MNKEEFKELLEEGHNSRFKNDVNKGFVKILNDNLPKSIEFLLVSEYFSGMCLGDTMDYVTELLKETFKEGYYKTRMVGSTITYSEFLERKRI